MSSNFYQSDLHNETCVELANLQRSVNKNQIENRTSSYLVIFLMGVHVLLILDWTVT